MSEEKIPTVEEFMEQYPFLPESNIYQVVKQALVDFAKLHVEAALKAAAENVQYNLKTINHPEDGIDIDKESILTAYPPENIK